jgi:hypothetical protein
MHKAFMTCSRTNAQQLVCPWYRETILLENSRFRRKGAGPDEVLSLHPFKRKLASMGESIVSGIGFLLHPNPFDLDPKMDCFEQICKYLFQSFIPGRELKKR